jgi:outer membrane protein assembly complex protein YaeT
MRESELFSVSNNRSYKRPRPQKISRLIHLFLAFLVSGVFSTSNVLCQDDELMMDQEKPFRIVFEGNLALSEMDLKKAAAEELIAFEKDGLRQSDVDDAAFQMEIAYRKAGFAFARVDYGIEQIEGKPVVTFSVLEGPRVIVKKIDMKGNVAYDVKTLLAFFEEEKRGLFRNGQILFIRSDIEDAVSRIRDYYVSQGFLDVVVQGPSLSFSEDRSEVIVTISISEGKRYIIREICFQGEVIPDAGDALEKARKELVGASYFGRRKLTLQNRVDEIYGNFGFPKTKVDITEQLDAKSGRVGLAVRITKGPRVTISEILVRGNERTRQKFIRRRLGIKPGARFNLEEKTRSFRRLYQTGLFSKVDVRLEEREGTDQWPLMVEVEEARAKELYFEPGWGSYEKLRLKGGFREKNLFGTGRIFGLDATVSLKAQSLVARLSDPWFFNTDITADLPVYYSRREEPSFTRTDKGASILFSKKLTNHLSASAGYHFRITNISEVSPEIAVSDIAKDYDLASVKIQTTYDTRDDLFFPTKGQRSFFSAEHADDVLGGEITFTRLTGGMRYFFPIAKHTILGLRYTTGLIIPGRDEITVPIAERFFNGGENTVRSFKQSELGPKDLSGDPVGGQAFNTLNIELRQRLIGNLTGTVFADYGNVSPNKTRIERGLPPYDSRSDLLSDTFSEYFRGFRPGIGCGLQYLLPVGPARLEIAFNPDRNRERDEDLYAVHFSVGMAF